MTVDTRDLRIRGRLVRIGSLHSDGFDRLEEPAAVISHLRAMQATVDVFTFVQTLPLVEPQFDYPMEWDNFAALRVQTFEHWWTSQIDNKTRNMVRKSEKKGVVVKEVPFDQSFVAGIHGIYNETPVRQGKQFWHFGKDVQTVGRENATFLDQSVFIGAFLDARLIGFVKLVIDKCGGQAGMMQILSMTAHRDVAPTNALIAQVVRSCADRGIPYARYANFSYGAKHHDSLVVFKTSNGFQRVEVPRYFVPVTMRGRLAMQLGLHHRLRDRIPETVLTPLRELRRRWYAQKLSRQTRHI
jgi:hypothetical protein